MYLLEIHNFASKGSSKTIQNKNKIKDLSFEDLILTYKLLKPALSGAQIKCFPLLSEELSLFYFQNNVTLI